MSVSKVATQERVPVMSNFFCDTLVCSSEKKKIKIREKLNKYAHLSCFPTNVRE